MLTMQQIFDNALFGMRAQGYERSTKMGHCAYRGDNGSKCGIGHSIPDDLYDPRMDSTVGCAAVTNWLGPRGAEYPHIRAVFVDLFGRYGSDGGISRPFLTEIQGAHDAADDGDGPNFERAMKSIAGMYGLTYAAPEV